MDKRSTFLGVFVLAAVVLGSAPVCAGLVGVTNYTDSNSLWQGFPPSFDPDWQGDTAIVELPTSLETCCTSLETCCTSGTFTLGNVFLSSGGDFTLGVPQPWQERRWTVNRVSSWASAQATAQAQADFGGKHYSASTSDSDSNARTNYAEFARYAEIVTDSGLLLANGSAIAYQRANIGARSFSVDGRFSAVSCLANVVPTGSVSASGDSSYRAKYDLERDTPFSLDLDLSQLGEADLVFQAVDAATDEVVFAFDTLSGASRHVELDGILAAGEYTFTLDGSADTRLDSAGCRDLGGMVSYDVTLDFHAESYWVTHYPPGWNGDPAGGVAAPEPTTFALLLWGVAVLLVFRHRSTRSR